MGASSIEETEQSGKIVRVIDDMDSRILAILRENARTKNVEIARRVSLTEGGVRARIARMIRDGVIEKFTVITRTNDVGCIVLIKTQLDQTKLIMRRLRDMSSSVYETSGEFDLAAELRADSIDQLNRRVDEIRALPGVVETMTLIKLS
ncbi:MAG: Lrp/AsnC family transcriptional regulator [Methanomassiliicoccales archaeon]